MQAGATGATSGATWCCLWVPQILGIWNTEVRAPLLQALLCECRHIKQNNSQNQDTQTKIMLGKKDEEIKELKIKVSEMEENIALKE